MLLVIDMGNTNTVLGLMDGDAVVRTWRIRTAQRTTDEMGVMLLTLFGQHGVLADDIDGAICSSVVPDGLFTLEKAVRRYLELELLVVGRKLKTGLRIRTDNPREVGADRIVNAVAALEKYGGPVVIVDFGTATTVDCVTAEGAYIGGAIAPGLKISEEALFARTAKLPRVELAKPGSPIGSNTVAAMQSGLYWGYVGLVEKLVERCRASFAPDARVVATGGFSNLIAQDCDAIDEVDAWLTLRGLAGLYARNR